MAAQSVLPCISLPTLKFPNARCLPELTTVFIGSLKSDGISNSPKNKIVIKREKINSTNHNGLQFHDPCVHLSYKKLHYTSGTCNVTRLFI